MSPPEEGEVERRREDEAEASVRGGTYKWEGQKDLYLSHYVNWAI